MVYWDKTGFCLFYKRLERDKFKWPRQHHDAVLSLSEQQWQWLLSGYDVIGHEPVTYTHYGG